MLARVELDGIEVKRSRLWGRLQVLGPVPVWRKDDVEAYQQILAAILVGVALAAHVIREQAVARAEEVTISHSSS